MSHKYCAQLSPLGKVFAASQVVIRVSQNDIKSETRNLNRPGTLRHNYFEFCTVKGGSRQYIKKAIDILEPKNTKIECQLVCGELTSSGSLKMIA